MVLTRPRTYPAARKITTTRQAIGTAIFAREDTEKFRDELAEAVLTPDWLAVVVSGYTTLVNVPDNRKTASLGDEDIVLRDLGGEDDVYRDQVLRLPEEGVDFPSYVYTAGVHNIVATDVGTSVDDTVGLVQPMRKRLD